MEQKIISLLQSSGGKFSGTDQEWVAALGGADYDREVQPVLSGLKKRGRISWYRDGIGSRNEAILK